MARPPTLIVGRRTEVGGLPVGRILPTRGRRFIGAWCFADHLGPAPIDERGGMQIGPHPHTGLQTVTWLVAGDVLHRDSLGTEQSIRPGQLNIMTSGRGISHAEETLDEIGAELHGVQLWIALPESVRDQAGLFEHFDALPQTTVGSMQVTVLVGSTLGLTSPARVHSPLVGLELVGGPGETVLPLDASFEHGLFVLEGEVVVDGVAVQPGTLACLARRRSEVKLRTDAPARVMLLGGAPFGEKIVMWWNFVARDWTEIDAAVAQWNAEGADGAAQPRFGVVRSPLPRLPSPVRP